MGKSRADVPFINQQLMMDQKTVQLEIDIDMLIAKGDKLEITFSDVVDVFITRIVRELDLSPSDGGAPFV